MLVSVLVGVGAFVIIFVAHADSTPPGLMVLTEVHGCLATIYNMHENSGRISDAGVVSIHELLTNQIHFSPVAAMCCLGLQVTQVSCKL